MGNRKRGAKQVGTPLIRESMYQRLILTSGNRLTFRLLDGDNHLLLSCLTPVIEEGDRQLDAEGTHIQTIITIGNITELSVEVISVNIVTVAFSGLINELKSGEVLDVQPIAIDIGLSLSKVGLDSTYTVVLEIVEVLSS